MKIYRILSGAMCAFALSANAQPTAPDTNASIAVSGLEKPASVLIDRWGVPHIYAGTLYDAFFVQGFTAARDRLWQIDLWRKRGLGEMAKDFGPDYAEGDVMARAVLFRGDMYREWLAYGSDAKRVAEAFVAGINAYVDQVDKNPDLLPVEFSILGYRPAHWQASDIVRIRHHGLTLNLTSEIDRAALYCLAGNNGPRADWLRRELIPPVTPKIPEGLNPCTVPAEALKRAYALATAAPKFPKASWQATRSGPPSYQELYAVVNDASDAARGLGSNNWTVSGTLTDTGRPILANDPHRTHGAPSLRYISHLNAPGLDVIGAGEPFLPGISIGHNEKIAFGLTRFYMDQEDLYVYEINPDRPDQYLYQNRWEAMTTVTEKIDIKGQPSRMAHIAFTRHGPVLYADIKTARAWVLRAAWLDYGMAPYFGSMDYMRATNWDQFRAAMNRWGAPGENQVYADTDGNIGWIPAGLTVIRPNWDGLLPVPGDGRFEWAGYRNMDELPFAFNPPAGYIVTANENTIPPEHPAMSKGIGYEWSDPARSLRLQGLFAANPHHALNFSTAWQNDTVSVTAQRIVKLLDGLSAPDPHTQQALDMLRGWDGDLRADSAPAAIFEVWFTKYLRPAAVRAALPAPLAEKVGIGDASRITLMLENPQEWMTPAERDGVLVSSLPGALDELTQRLGPDMSQWKWGDLHKAVFEHRLADIVDDVTRSKLDVGPWPIGGSATTPMATSYRPQDFGLASGASFRMVLDVGGWDASRVINAPGQSGDPNNPHYRDLAPLWAASEYFPLLYTREAIERETTERFDLVPVGAAQ